MRNALRTITSPWNNRSVMKLRGLSGSRSRFVGGGSVLRYSATMLLLGVTGLLLVRSALRDRLRPGAEDYRPVEGRLSGDFTYAPAPPIGVSEKMRSAPRQAHISRGESEDARLRYLVAEEPAKVVMALERARETLPRNPRALNNLSVAYLARASRERRPEDLPRALSAATAALRLDPSLLEAAFNRALALERLSLKGAAIEGWNAYLELDSDSEWGVEAEERRQDLVRPTFWESWEPACRRLGAAAHTQDSAAVREIVHTYPQPAREYAETQVLGAWGDAVITGDAVGAQRSLWLAAEIGALLVEVTGDLMVADAVALVRRANANPMRLEALARGHQNYRNAREAYDALDLERADPLLELARTDLERGGSPFATWPVFYRAVCAYPRGEYEDVLDRFGGILRNPERSRYPVLLGYAEWMTGLILSNRGQLGEALDRYRRALHLFEKTLQAQNVAVLHDLIANDLDHLGDVRGAWVHLSQALVGSDQVLKRRWVVTILQKAADAALRMELPAAAFELHREAVRVARQQFEPLVVSEALVSRSLSRHRLGDEAGALRDLDKARRWVTLKPDSPMRRVVEAQLEAAMGKVLRRREPHRAIAAFSAALDLYRGRGAHVLSTDLYVERGRSYLGLGLDDLAEKDFEMGIQDFERNRQRIFAEGLRISYFEQVRAVFDEMVQLQLRKGSPWRAFRFSEQARARELLDTLAVGPAGPLLESLEDGQNLRLLPDDLILLHYAVLKDCTVIWVLTRDGRHIFERRIPARELQLRVRKLTGAIKGRVGEDQIRGLAAELFDELVRPVAKLLRSGATLVLVPDSFLHELPFSVLYDSIADKYLIEQHPIAVAPSATLVLQGWGSSTHPIGEFRKALVVGNPQVDPQRFPGVAGLPGAEAEARKIATLYPDAEILIGMAATPGRFLAELGRYDVVHFGGHAISNEEFPQLSMLLLAPDEVSKNSGALLAHEIYGRNFENTRLVVLGACNTARSRISPGEGVLGLARPFLAGGVSQVLATLWEVDDKTSPAIFEVFHRRLRLGDSPAQALRAAQLALLGSPRPKLRAPAAWAPFEVIQGSGS